MLVPRLFDLDPIRACSTSHDTRYPTRVRVEYPLHPQYGQELSVVRYDGSGDARRILVQRADNCLFVPVWMVDAHVCSHLTYGLLPFASWSALLHLREFLSVVDQSD